MALLRQGDVLSDKDSRIRVIEMPILGADWVALGVGLFDCSFNVFAHIDFVEHEMH